MFCFSSTFKQLREEKDFFDVSLVCEDNSQVEAHKVVLSACSPFFKAVLQRNPHQHPLMFLKGVHLSDLTSILNFMYLGEANIAQEDLTKFLAVAEDLQIKGLTQEENSNQPVQSKHSSITPTQRKSKNTSVPQRTPVESHANDDDEIQEVQVNDVKPEPREVIEVAPDSGCHDQEVATFEGYDNYDGYQEGYQGEDIHTDSHPNTEQYGKNLLLLEHLGAPRPSVLVARFARCLSVTIFD